MSDPAVVLTQRLVAALGEVSADAAGTDPVVRPSDRADFQANGVMGLAKRLGTNPRELAQRVVDAVDLDGIASIEIAGPGFLNLTLDDDFLGRAIGEQELGACGDQLIPTARLIERPAHVDQHQQFAIVKRLT